MRNEVRALLASYTWGSRQRAPFWDLVKRAQLLFKVRRYVCSVRIRNYSTKLWKLHNYRSALLLCRELVRKERLRLADTGLKLRFQKWTAMLNKHRILDASIARWEQLLNAFVTSPQRNLKCPTGLQSEYVFIRRGDDPRLVRYDAWPDDTEYVTLGTMLGIGQTYRVCVFIRWWGGQTLDETVLKLADTTMFSGERRPNKTREAYIVTLSEEWIQDLVKVVRMSRARFMCDGPTIKHLHDISIHDVSTCTMKYYTNTSAHDVIDMQMPRKGRQRKRFQASGKNSKTVQEKRVLWDSIGRLIIAFVFWQGLDARNVEVAEISTVHRALMDENGEDNLNVSRHMQSIYHTVRPHINAYA